VNESKKERKTIRIRFCRPDGTIYDIKDEILDVVGDKALYNGRWYPIKKYGTKLVIDVV